MTHYSSFSQFARTHRLQCLPRPRETWRLVQLPVVGGIIGLDHCFRGLAIATNGIIVAIETSAGNILFGHLQYFQKDNDDEPTDLDLNFSAFRNKKTMKTIEAFEELFI